MKKTKIKMIATIAVQFLVNSEVEGVVVDGNFYAPLMPGVPGTVVAITSEEDAPIKKSEPTVAKEVKKSAPTEKYTEAQLMDTEKFKQKDLEKIIVSLGGTVPDDDTKNTNKRLRLIIIGLQDGGAEEENEEEEVKPKAKAKTSVSPVKAINAILQRLDEGEIEDDADAVAELVELGGSKKNIAKIVATFMASPKEPITTFQKQLADEIGGTEDTEEEEAPSKKAPMKVAKTKEKVVEADELEVGNVVNIWWEDNEDFFKGKVIKTDRKGVLIEYDEDQSQEYIDAENNTIIHLLN